MTNKKDLKKFNKDNIVTLESEYYLDFEAYYDERTESIVPKNNYFKYKLGEYTLKDGEYTEVGVYQILKKEKPVSEEPLKWNKETNEWVVDEEEKIRLEEIRQREIFNNYFETVDRLKALVLHNGFEFNGHQQKCRDKDIAYMTATIETIKDAKELTGKDINVIWAFNDEDAIEVDLLTLRLIRVQGSNFINKVFAVEKIFKKMTPFDIQLSDYIQKVGEIK